MATNQRKVGEAKSEIITRIPLACTDEAAAVEFMEQSRWGDKPFCPHCGCMSVYQMKDAMTGARNKRYLWRCHDCKKQFSVRTNAVYEESRIPLRHWCYAFWRASTSKKGASALEIKRHTGLSYKSALFMMHRIRYAMGDDSPTKLKGIIEADETYVGGKPPRGGQHRPKYDLKPGENPPLPRRFGGPGEKLVTGRGTKKTPVVALIERGGNVHARVMPNVTAKNIREAMEECVDFDSSTLMTDEFTSYKAVGRAFKGGHERVKHREGEYSRGQAHCNSAESFFALIKRGMYGTFHNVSKKHLHRYVSEFAFRWNGRKLEDGERVVAAIRGADGKRLYYKVPAA